eukprot:8972511-Ditylum_brightwellii.AAC.1
MSSQPRHSPVHPCPNPPPCPAPPCPVYPSRMLLSMKSIQPGRMMSIGMTLLETLIHFIEE